MVWKGVTAAREAIEQATLAKEGADRKTAKEAEDAAAKVRIDLETKLASVTAALSVPAPVDVVADKLRDALALVAEAGAAWETLLSENSARHAERASLTRQLGLAADEAGESSSDLEARIGRIFGARGTADAIKATTATLGTFCAVLGRFAAATAERDDRRSRLRSDLSVVKRTLEQAENSVKHWKRQLDQAAADAHDDPNSQVAFKALDKAIVEHERYVEIRNNIAAQAAGLTRDIEALS